MYIDEADYEANGNIKKITWRSNGSADYLYAFTYDDYNRLLTADATGGTIGSSGDVGYKYDANGNILGLNRQSLDTATETHSYVAGSNRLQSALGKSYSHDRNGNVTYDQRRGWDSIQYNYLNLPKVMQRDVGVLESVAFGYDGASQRLWKKETKGSDTSQRWYVRTALGHTIAELVANSGETVMQFGMTIDAGTTLEVTHGATTEQYSSSDDGGTIVANSTDAVHYKPVGSGAVRFTSFSTFADGAPHVSSVNFVAPGGEMLGEKRFATTETDYYYLKDHLGSIRIKLKQDGTVVAENDFYPYGKLLRQVETGAENRYEFTGKERDAETAGNGVAGVDYFGARVYDAEVGVWWGVDPLAEKYSAWSPYNYALDSPLKYVDPDGNKIVLGSTFDRIASFFGYKTENLKYIEAAAKRLKQSETGRSLYNELDAIEQEIVVEIGNLPENPDGSIQLGETRPTGNLEKNKFEGATVILDPANIKKNAVDWKREVPKNAAAITLGHEFGHAKAAKDNLRKYTEEKKAGVAEDKQAKPYENKIRIELMEIKKEKN